MRPSSTAAVNAATALAALHRCRKNQPAGPSPTPSELQIWVGTPPGALRPAELGMGTAAQNGTLGHCVPPHCCRSPHTGACFFLLPCPAVQATKHGLLHPSHITLLQPSSHPAMAWALARRGVTKSPSQLALETLESWQARRLLVSFCQAAICGCVGFQPAHYHMCTRPNGHANAHELSRSIIPAAHLALVCRRRRRATSCRARWTRTARCWTTSRWSCGCTHPPSRLTTTRMSSGQRSPSTRPTAQGRSFMCVRSVHCRQGCMSAVRSRKCCMSTATGGHAGAVLQCLVTTALCTVSVGQNSLPATRSAISPFLGQEGSRDVLPCLHGCTISQQQLLVPHRSAADGATLYRAGPAHLLRPHLFGRRLVCGW